MDADLIVIGAGPSGSSSARLAAGSGLKVCVLERKDTIGEPVQCGEAISKRCLELTGFDESEEWIIERIEGYRINSPSGGSLVAPSDGFSIDRGRFDRSLAEAAERSGAVIRKGENVQECEVKDGKWNIKTSKGIHKAKFIIAAAGPIFEPGKKLGFSRNPVLMKAVGAKIKFKDDSRVMDFFTAHRYESGYGWWFPRGNEVNTGFVSNLDNRALLIDLLRSKGIRIDGNVKFYGGLIPIGGPIRKFIGHNTVAVGDLGGFCHPVSKGGIHAAILSGIMAAEAVVEADSGKKRAFKDLKDKIDKHPAFSRGNIKINGFLSSLRDGELDALTSVARGRNIRDINRKEALKEAMAHPKLVKVAVKGLKLVLEDKQWMDFTF